MQNIIGGLSATALLEPIDAANTAAATSGWVDLRFMQGLIALVCYAGILDAGSLTWTFTSATDTAGTGSAAIVPVNGALTAVTTANDNPNIQVAFFDAKSHLGFMQAVGTIVTGGALVSVAALSLPTYP